MGIDLNRRMKDSLEAGTRQYNSPDWEKLKWQEIDSLSMAYRYFGELEKSQDLFRQRAEHISHNMGPKDFEKDKKFQDQNGSRVRLGILYDLAGESGKAKEEYEWAAAINSDFYHYCNENCIAAFSLWYGYANLALGRIEEAYDAILHTTPYF